MKIFSAGQLIRLWIIYVLTTSLAFMIKFLFQYAEYQGWLALLGSYILSLVLAYFVVRVMQAGKGRGFIEFGKRWVGAPFHSFMLFGVFIHCLALGIFNLHDFTEFMSFVYLRNTPDSVISLIFISCATITAYLGLRTIVYMSDGFFILLSLSIVFTIPLLFKNLEPAMGVALFTHFELSKFTFPTFYITNWIGDFVLALFFLTHFQTNGKTHQTFAIANIIVVGVTLLYWLISLLLFGPHLSGQLRYPILELIRYFEIGEFLENIDPLVVSIWSSALLLKSALLLYIASKITTSFFQPKKQQHRKTILLILGCIIWASTVILSKYPAEYLTIVSGLPVNYFLFTIKFIPIIYFIVYKLRFRKQKAASQ